MRNREHGSPYAEVRWIDLEERIRNYLPTEPNENGCMIWRGPIGSDGYGEIGVDGVTLSAHRFVFERLTGTKLTSAQTLDHVCHTRDPHCTNPCPHRLCCSLEHLEVVSLEVNSQRRWDRLESCAEGHAFSPENTAYTSDGRRQCIKCRNARVARQRLIRAISRR